MGNSASVKYIGKIPGVNKTFGYKWASKIDRGLGKAFGTGPQPVPDIPVPPPPESIDEGAYIARDRSRRRAKLVGGRTSTMTGAGAAYSPAPKQLIGQ